MKKLIKRGFAALLALTLALGMSVSAFAAEGPAATEPAVAEKDYRLTNDKTTSPEETFQFTVTKVGVTDATDEHGNKLTEADMPNLTITPSAIRRVEPVVQTASRNSSSLRIRISRTWASILTR